MLKLLQEITKFLSSFTLLLEIRIEYLLFYLVLSPYFCLVPLFESLRQVCHLLSSLFVQGLLSHSRIFHSYGNVTITGEGLQILTYALYSWPQSSEGSLACHTYCDTGHLFIIWSSPRTRDTHTYCHALSSEAVTTRFYNLGLSQLGFEHPTFSLQGQRSNHCTTATVLLSNSS